VTKRIRTCAREILTSCTLAQIRDMFEAEDFEPVDQPDLLGGQRRNFVEQFYSGIDWTSWDDVRRYLRILEEILPTKEQVQVDGPTELEQFLTRDGFLIDGTGSIRPAWEVLTTEAVINLPEESAIPGHIRRMWSSVEERPEQAISAAKDAVEATAKYALSVLGEPLTGREKFPALIDMVQRKLKLHPTSVAPTAKGAESITQILGSLASIVNSSDEVRNLYGDGHGRSEKVSGLTSRHSRLVARCADAYIGMILDTLIAPGAPWRKPPTIMMGNPADQGGM
jgi:hypothetical protein